MTTSDRLKTHLLRRLRRHSLRTLFQRACSADLLIPEDITVGTVSVRRYRVGPLAEIATGHSGRDIVRRRLAHFLTASVATPADPHAEVVKALIEEGFDVGPSNEFVAGGTVPTKTDGKEKRVKLRAPSAPLLARPLLDHLKQAALPLPVMHVAIVILLAEALRASGCSEAILSKALKSPAPLICLRLPTREAEAVVSQLLQQGAILPHPIHLVDALHHSFNDRWSPDDGAPPYRTVLSYPLTQLLAVSAERLRRTLAKATRAGAPILVLTETEFLWPRRVMSSADIVLDASRLDNRMLAEIIETCLGIPIESTLNGLATRTIKTGSLGLDDLALSIRPDRLFDDVLDRLEQLSRDNLTIDGDDETEEESSAGTRKGAKDEDEEKTDTASRSTSSERSRGKGGKHQVELILPQRIQKKRGSQPPLLLETLAGYGEARLWALELKADLKLWKRKKIRWSDMSTKLLLSGPPGTGKTTFAKALCNSLEIPLIATSVAEWLEPGYLGDVLRRMTAVFEAAQARQPVIMLIDEIDGIGRRDAGGGRSYDDYWISVINRLLELLDGALKSEGVIIIGATNRPDVIDPALRRSGRLETHITIEPPDLDALEGILAHHLGPDLRRVMANAAQAKAFPAHPQEAAHG